MHTPGLANARYIAILSVKNTAGIVPIPVPILTWSGGLSVMVSVLRMDMNPYALHLPAVKFKSSDRCGRYYDQVIFSPLYMYIDRIRRFSRILDRQGRNEVSC